MKIGGLHPFSLIDYPQHICATVFTIGCNFRCPYCHNPELVEETAPVIASPDSVIEFLKRRQSLVQAVTITGGEPTMHDDLPDFMRRIKALGFLVKLDSNGTHPAMLKKLFQRRLVDYVAMDIKGPFSRYQENAGRPVDCDAINQSIRFIMESGVDYEFRTTVVRSLLSFDDFHAIGEMIRGASRYALQQFVPGKILNPQFIKKTTYSKEEFLDLKHIMEEYVATCVVRV